MSNIDLSTDEGKIRAISNNTSVIHGKTMETNVLRNFPALAKAYGMKSLRRKLAGVPCIVAGAGPSLTSAIPELLKHQGSYILIAVDRSLKPLLAAGLVPHIVCTSDMDKILVNLFQGYRIPDSVALFFDRNCYHELPAAWQGKLLASDDYFDTGIWASTFLGNKGFICKNFTVSHTAHYVAASMGCAPIILTGVDFAYPSKEEHHADGAVQIEDEADFLHRSHWLDVPGNVAELVRTTEVFSIAALSFGAGVAEARSQVINTSEVGAKIKHVPYSPLAETLAAYAKPGDYQAKIDQLLEADPPTFDYEMWDKQSSHVIQAMTKIHNQCVEGIELCERLKKLDITNSTERGKWGRVFLKVNRKLKETQQDVFSHYLMARMALQGTKRTKDLLESVKDLKENDNKRLMVEFQRHCIYLWFTGVCCKIFVDSLTASRKEIERCYAPKAVVG